MTQSKSWMVQLPGVQPAQAKPSAASRAKGLLPTGASNPQTPQGLGLTSAVRRRQMAQSCADLGVKSDLVLGALSHVERHLFIDEGLASRAYEDCALPIGHGQTISKPSSVARMIELVLQRRDGRPASELKALEIGTGCGYQAAVMAYIFKEIISVERIRALGDLARNNLRRLRLSNLRLVVGDGHAGVPKEAPFDAIIVAAAGLSIPQALLEQLSIGGLLIAPVVVAATSPSHGGVETQEQCLHWVERRSKTDWQLTVLDSARFVPLKSGVI